MILIILIIVTFFRKLKLLKSYLHLNNFAPIFNLY